MISIRSTVNNACQLAGLIAADEVADGTDAQIAVQRLNDVLSQLNTESLLPYSKTMATYTVLAPTTVLTIGLPDGQVAYERPVHVERLYVTLPGGPRELRQMELGDLFSRQLVDSTIPSYFAVNRTYPLSELHFDANLPAGSALRILYNKALPTVDINSQLAMPPEYSDLLVTALARRMAILKAMPTETVAQCDTLFKESVGRIRSMNVRASAPILEDLYGSTFGRRGSIYDMGA